MKLGILFVFGLGCLAGMVSDAAASVFGLIAWLNVKGVVGQFLVGGFGIVVTAFVTGTKYAFAPRTPWILTVIWLMCVLVDVWTTIIGLVHFVLNDGTLHGAVVSSPAEMLKIASDRPGQAIFVLFMQVIITSATIASPYCLDGFLPPLPPEVPPNIK